VGLKRPGGPVIVWWSMAVAILVVCVGTIALSAAASAHSYRYDLAPIARVDTREIGAGGLGPTLLLGAREESVSASVEDGDACTTLASLRLATNTVGIPSSSDTKLQNYIDQLYKHANKPGTVGNGTTMDAIPGEIAAGGGRHIQKGEEIARGLRNWLSRNPNAPYCDRLLAQSLYDELVRALGYVPS
jgi:hypothetical protein